MFLFGITLLPLGQHLLQAAPNTHQPWFADDFLIFGPSSVAADICLEVTRVGTSVGYHPEPDKMCGNCPRRDEVAIRAQFAAKGVPIPIKLRQAAEVRGRGYVGRQAMRERWLKPK